MSLDKIEEKLVQPIQELEIRDLGKEMKGSCGSDEGCHLDCAICWNKIALQETALIKGCEHAYCVMCILRWASYEVEKNKGPTCPMCKHPFESLVIHRSLDGSIRDYMQEESICLLLRASWFNPLVVVEREEIDEEVEDYCYEEADEDLDEFYLNRSSNIRIGNRRFGDNGYVRSGRQEARPAYRPSLQDACPAGTSRNQKVGRRAKRTLKREAAAKGL